MKNSPLIQLIINVNLVWPAAFNVKLIKLVLNVKEVIKITKEYVSAAVLLINFTTLKYNTVSIVILLV